MMAPNIHENAVVPSIPALSYGQLAEALDPHPRLLRGAWMSSDQVGLPPCAGGRASTSSRHCNLPLVGLVNIVVAQRLEGVDIAQRERHGCT
jgi:hypothetical protein